MTPVLCKVIKDYNSPYTAPWKIKVGESLKIIPKESDWPGWIWCANDEGEGRWVPGTYVKQYGSYGVALVEYEAVELSVPAGDEVAVLKEESGWCWCRTKDKREGWLPKSHISF